MNLKAVLVVVFCALYGLAFSQNGDLIVRISNSTTADNKFIIYKVSIENFSDSPVCILHSLFINLFDGRAQMLALVRKDRKNDKLVQFYNLDYTVTDTSRDYEGKIINLNGELILPLQEIKFELLIPSSDREKYLQFEYLRLSDFCYRDFRKAILKNATEWYRKYERIEKMIGLPK